MHRIFLPGMLMLFLAWSPGLGASEAEDDDPPEKSKPGHPISPRNFEPERVRQALLETEARQRDFYERQVEKGHHKGVLTVLGSALGRYGLDREVDKANSMMETRYERA